MKLKNTIVASLLLAVTLYLPFLTGQIPQIGAMLSPMHIPVLLCGFICGGSYAMAIGAIAPVLRFFMFGMPPLFPTGLAMTVELAVYGLCAGLLYKSMAKKTSSVYISLIVSMLVGRLAWGATMFAISMVSRLEFGVEIFLAGAFINAVPGIVVHIALIPALVLALEKAGYTVKSNFSTVRSSV